MYRNVDQLAYIHQAELLAEADNERLIRSLPKKAGRRSVLPRVVGGLAIRPGHRIARKSRETTSAA